MSENYPPWYGRTAPWTASIWIELVPLALSPLGLGVRRNCFVSTGDKLHEEAICMHHQPVATCVLFVRSNAAARHTTRAQALDAWISTPRCLYFLLINFLSRRCLDWIYISSSVNRYHYLSVATIRDATRLSSTFPRAASSIINHVQECDIPMW